MPEMNQEVTHTTGKKITSAINFAKLDRAAAIAYYYGFIPTKTPHIQREDVLEAKRIIDSEFSDSNYAELEERSLRIIPEEKVALLRQCEALLNPAGPLLVYYEGTPDRVDEKKQAPSERVGRINLDILGTTKSVAEAELIKTTFEILHDKGFEDLYVEINSIGDKDSLPHFMREVHQFYRKHAEEMPSHCRTEAKKNTFAPLECKNEKCRAFSENAPKSVSFLSEASRLHFKEVLEYLESLRVPYKIDNHLLGLSRICSHTIFLVKTLNVSGAKDTAEETLALGYRYNTLAKKLETRKDIPAVGITIITKALRRERRSTHSPKTPRVYFIPFGFDAKLKSLEVIEVLRQAKIPLHQALAKDKLSSQIATAEHMGIPYCVIMGQKEALENSVIVRDMRTRFQETVGIKGLADYLKKLPAK